MHTSLEMSPSGNLAIRPRESADVPMLIDILTNVHKLTQYPVDGPTSFPARFASEKALISLVALYESKLAGHAELQDPSSLNTEVKSFLAAQAELSSFVALSLLFVEDWGRQNGKRLVLIVLEKDKTATRMYEKLGWVRSVEYFYESIHKVEYKAFLYVAPA